MFISIFLYIAMLLPLFDVFLLKGQKSCECVTVLFIPFSVFFFSIVLFLFFECKSCCYTVEIICYFLFFFFWQKKWRKKKTMLKDILWFLKLLKHYKTVVFFAVDCKCFWKLSSCCCCCLLFAICCRCSFANKFINENYWI